MDLRGFKPEDQGDWDGERGSRPVIPNNWYLAAIVRSDEKQVKGSNTNTYLQLDFQVLEGEYSGSEVVARLNLKNANPQAQRIANAELACICKAVSVNRPNDSRDLHDLPLMIHVKVEPRSDDKSLFNNRIINYAPRSEKAAKLAEGSKKRETVPPNGNGENQNDAPPWQR